MRNRIKNMFQHNGIGSYRSCLWFTLAGCLLLLSCSSSNEAQRLLQEAKSALAQQNFDLAKLKIDSIQTTSPKAFDEINEAILLMKEVRRAENTRNIAFCDSMILVNENQLRSILPKYAYVRDERYQEFGEYQSKKYPFSQSLNQNGLRAAVSEQGVLYIESVVRNSGNKHTHIKVQLGDGSFAETLPVSADGLNYTFSTLGGSYQIVRYRGVEENNVAQFIHSFQDQPIIVQFIGNRTTSAQLSTNAKKAIGEAYELSTLLLNIEQLKFEREKSEVLLKYLDGQKNISE